MSESRERTGVRFYTAVVLFAVSAIALAVGFGQQIFFRAESAIVETIDVTAGGSAQAPLTVIDGTTLAAHEGKVTVALDGTSGSFAAVAPSADVDAWVANTVANRVTGTGADLNVQRVGKDASAPNPAGSDLWIQEQASTSSLQMLADTPSTSSILIASNGTNPAPTSITLTWPNVNPRPWALPLTVTGYLLLIAGFVVLLIDRIANRRGPRRRSHRGRRVDRSTVSELKTRQRTGVNSRRALAVGGLAVAVMLSGCTGGGPLETPAASSAAPNESDAAAPPVSKVHFQTILNEVVDVANRADADLNADELSSRFADEALASRAGYYALKSKFPEKTAITPLQSDPVSVFVPQTGKDFPRTALVGVTPEGGQPTVLVLRQQSARENYKVVSLLEHVSTLPDLPSGVLGSDILSSDTTRLRVRPDQLASQFGDVLAHGSDSSYASAFTLDDPFTFISQRRQAVIDQNNEAGFRENGRLEVTYPEGATKPVTFTTSDGSGLVFVSIDETWTVKPAQENGVIKIPPGEDATVLGKSETKTGLQRVYTTMLAFSVPKDDSSPIDLVGFTWGLSSIKEL